MVIREISDYDEFHRLGLKLNFNGVSLREMSEKLAFSNLSKHHLNIQLLAVEDEVISLPILRILVYYKPEEPTIAYWGWYESIEHPQIVQAWNLIAQSQHNQGALKLKGPISGNTWFDYRYKISAQPPLMYGEPLFNELYLNQLHQVGFGISKKFRSTWLDVETGHEKSIEHLNAWLKQKKLSFETISEDIEHRHLKDFHELTMSSFAENEGFEPIDFETYALLMKGLSTSIDRQLSFAFFHNGKPVAYILTQHVVELPFFVNAQKKQTRVLRNMAVSPHYRNQFLGMLLSYYFHSLCVQFEIKNFVYALMAENHITDKAVERFFKAKTLAHYALFEREC